jgi:hypothetical protein
MLTAISPKWEALTFQVFGTLPLFTWLADDLDRATRENANDPLRFIVRGWSGDLNQGLHLLLFLVNIRDEKLFPNAATKVGGPSGRIVDIERLARGARPFNGSLLWSRLA